MGWLGARGRLCVRAIRPFGVTRKTALCALAVSLTAATATAGPTPPDGWSINVTRDAAIYTPDDRQDVELRVYPVAATRAALVDWFATRRQTAPSGMSIAAWGEVADQSGILIATGAGTRGKTQLAVIAIGCKTAKGMRYAELVAPMDQAAIEAYGKPALEVALGACVADGGATAAASARDTAEAGAKTAPEREPASAPATTSKSKDFPYRAADGHGLDPKDIQAVLYSWEQIYEIGGLQMYEWMYLVLKDGTVRKGLPPVGPQDFDAAAERKAEPALWGRWKKKGGDYLFAWDDAKEWKKPPGQLVRSPGKKNERLDHSYSTSSSYQVPGGAGAWSKSTISFDKKGRFSTYRNGGVGGSVGDGSSEGTVTTAGVWDDDGSATSVSAPNFGGGGSTKRASTLADREGTYKIDGYSIELHFDSGRVERQFFYVTDDRHAVYWNGAEYAYFDD